MSTSVLICSVALCLACVLVQPAGALSAKPRHRAAAHHANADAPEVYAVVVDGSDSYVAGLQALGASLLESNATRPLVVVTTGEPSEKLSQTVKCLGLQIVRRPSVASDKKDGTFDKLSVFTLPAKRVVYLDADTVVLKNIDSLFEQSAAFQAAQDCPGLGHPLAAGNRGGCFDRFDSGVMVLNPSKSVFADMQSKLEKLLADVPDYEGGAQSFLNQYLREAWQKPGAVLNQTFNTAKHQELSPNFDLGSVAVLHHRDAAKPWTPSGMGADKVAPLFQKSHGAFWSALEKYRQRCGSAAVSPPEEPVVAAEPGTPLGPLAGLLKHVAPGLSLLASGDAADEEEQEEEGQDPTQKTNKEQSLASAAAKVTKEMDGAAKAKNDARLEKEAETQHSYGDINEWASQR